MLTSTTPGCEGRGCGEDEVASPDDTIIGSISDPAAPNVTSQLVAAESGTPNATVGIGDSAIEGIFVSDVARSADLAIDTTTTTDDPDDEGTTTPTSDPEITDTTETVITPVTEPPTSPTVIPPPVEVETVTFNLLEGRHNLPADNYCTLYTRNDESVGLYNSLHSQFSYGDGFAFGLDDEPFQEYEVTIATPLFESVGEVNVLQIPFSMEVATITCRPIPEGETPERSLTIPGRY